MAFSTTKRSFTWTWAEDLVVNEYANGDKEVVAPAGLTLLSITPASAVIASRQNVNVSGVPTGTFSTNSVINGTMLNPDGNEATIPQGFDSAAATNPYLSTKNIGRVGNLPLHIDPGSSLVSTISKEGAGWRPQLEEGEILTVVASASPAGSFRPPYCGTDKTPHWNKADLDYSLFPSVPAPSGVTIPVLATVAGWFERPWFEINTGFAGRYIHPALNQPDYGEDIAKDTSVALQLLLLDYTDAEKETLYIRLVQYGIDIYGCAKTGGVWTDGGGHNHGRKMVLVLAGLALNDPDILEWGDAERHLIFQEDRQTFIVNEAQLSVIPYYADARERQSYAIKTGTVTFDPATDRVMWSNHGLFDTVPVTFSTNGVMAAPLVAGQTYLTRGETVTVSVASPAVVGWPAHGLSAGDTFRVTIPATNTDLPVPMVENATYYVIATGLTADSFQFSASPGGAAFNTTAPGDATPYTGLAGKYFKLTAAYKGSVIDITTAGTGTHTGDFNLLGISEWGEQHTSQITRDGANININYRGNVYGSSLGAVLASHLIPGAVQAWNWPPYQSYFDRIRGITVESDYPAFANAMWNEYRDLYAPPDAPTSLTATTISSSRIDLAWSDQSSDEDGFSIESSLDGISFTQLATVGAGVTTYSATGLSAAVTYYFRVRAFKNLGGYSDDYTNIDSSMTTVPPLTAGQPGTAGLLMSS